MTAINIVVQRDAAHVICDGARYNREGTLLGIGPKCEALPHIPALMAARGPCQATPIVLYHIAWKFHTFDDLLAGIEETLQDIVTTYGDYFDATGFPDIELYFVGYSEIRREFKAFTIHTFNAAEVSMHGVEQVGGVDMSKIQVTEPFKLAEMEDAVMAPCLPATKVRDILAGRDDVSEIDAVKDGLKILAAQRELKISIFPGDPPMHCVGGIALVSTVTRNGATQRVIHRWKEDRIGSPINPVRTAAPPAILLAPPGMSRLQRDILERKQRKALRGVG